MIEIERKFLVKSLDDLMPLLKEGQHIQQGYLFSEPNKSCRVRIKGTKGFLTVKYGSDLLSRIEFEYEIPLNDALELLNQCERSLQKIRYEIPLGNHVLEIDVFGGALDGLVLVEVELNHENETIQLPTWVGEEVTHDPKYLNVNLIKSL